MSTAAHIFFRSIRHFRYYLGKSLAELGLGSRMTDDVAYLEKLSRHRTFTGFYDIHPTVDMIAFVAPSSSLIGDVNVGPYASVWYNVVLKAEVNAIRIGAYSSIGDGTTIHTTNSLPTGVPASTNIGKNVIIQNNCSIYSCLIDDEVFIGARSIVLEGCKIEKGAVIAPNSFVPPGRLIPAGQLWGGNPVEYIRDITESERIANYAQTKFQWDSAKSHLDQFNDDSKNGEKEINSQELVNSYLNDNYMEWRAKYS